MNGNSNSRASGQERGGQHFNRLPVAQRWPNATATVAVGGPVRETGGSR